MNQGRSKKQMETKYKLTFWSFAGLIVTILLAVIFN